MGGTEQWLGRTLDGRWLLEDELGEGAMGRVFQARQVNLDREVAVKVIHPRHVHASTAIPRFLREARILATLQHPHIVRLIDFGLESQSQNLFLVMELLKGQSLAHYLEQGWSLSLLQILMLAEQVTMALMEVHAHGIIHRDLKPGNVFLQERGDKSLHATLLDFGIAYADGPERSRLTGEGVIQGTPDYISPEQIEDEPVTPASDLYALGLMLYQLCSGSLPYQGDTPIEVFLQKIHQRVPPLVRRWGLPETPPTEFTSLVDRLVERDPAQRPMGAEVLAVVREQLHWLQSRLARRRPASYGTAPNWNVSLAQEEPVARPSLRDTEPHTMALTLDEIELSPLRQEEPLKPETD